jgi:hypothetical protein
VHDPGANMEALRTLKLRGQHFLITNLYGNEIGSFLVYYLQIVLGMDSIQYNLEL